MKILDLSKIESLAKNSEKNIKIINRNDLGTGFFEIKKNGHATDLTLQSKYQNTRYIESVVAKCGNGSKIINSWKEFKIIFENL